MTKRFGFTLAEVLITLGIIGVVAAMTMPSLINSTQGAQYKAAYKKALSTISQAIVLNIALDDWGAAEADVTTTGATDHSLYTLFKTRMNVVKATNAGTTGIPITDVTQAATNTTLFFNDGITLSFPSASVSCTEAKPCKGFVDVNGTKGPNKLTKCTTGAGDTCTVDNPADVYEVRLMDQSILPNSAAARAVLYGK